MAINELDSLDKEMLQLEAALQVLMSEDEYEECEKSLYAYFLVAWQFFDSAPIKTNWHIGAIAEHLQACYEGQIKKVVFNVPPGTSKSSLISVAGPTWMWGPANAPYTKFMTASYGTSKGIDPATRDNVRSRRLMQTEWYRNRWRNRFKLCGDMNLKTVYENDKNGSRLATSIGGGGTGLHYDVLQIDDPSKAQDENSPVALDNVVEWWTGTLPSRPRDPETARKVLIMQRIAEKDLAGHVRENEDGWVLINLPMEYEPTVYISPLGWKDPRKVEGELLWPDRFSRVKVEELKKELGPYKYAAQYQQRPVPKGGGKIKEEWFRYFYAPAQQYDIIIQAWDLSFDDTDGADYTVGGVWGKLGGDRFLLDVVRGQMDVVAQAKAIANTYKKWPQSRAILVENKANGPAVIKLLKNSDWIEILKIRVSGLTPVDPKAMGGDKDARLSKCVPEFAAGNVWFMHPDVVPVMEQVKTELTQFPKAAHDDCVDMVSYGLNWLADNARVIYSQASDDRDGTLVDKVDKIRQFQRRLVQGEERSSRRDIREFF